VAAAAGNDGHAQTMRAIVLVNDDGNVRLDDWLASSEEGYLEDTDIPAGIPRDHWWWWHPNPPPA
jgi:hypothetical protein